MSQGSYTTHAHEVTLGYWKVRLEGRFELLKMYNANSGEITKKLIKWSITCMLWSHIKCSHKGRKDPKEEGKNEYQIQ